MNRKYILNIIILITVVILYPGCERGEFSWGTKIGNLVYSGNVIFLGSDELAFIKEIADDGIVFSDKAGEIEKITVGSILVMGVSEKTPYGSLRKATYIETNGSEIIINTSDALLTDAIKEGTIKIEKRLLEKDFVLKSKVEGVLVTGPEKSFDGLAVTLDNLEIFNDGSGSAKLDGAIGISAEIEITIEIRFNEIYEINLFTTLNKIDEITVTSDGAFDGNKEIVAAEFVHSPIIIDSLVIVPEVKISCGYEGSVQGGIISGVRQDRIISSEMHYQRSDWMESPLVHTESFDFIQPQVTDNSDLKVFSGPEVIVKLFNVPVQLVKATGFYSLVAERTGSPLWKLFIGSDGQNMVNADILGFREDHTFNMEIQASEISNANGK